MFLNFISWSVKDVMPFSTYKETEPIKNVAVISEGDVDAFLKMPRNWEEHIFSDDWVVPDRRL